MFNPSNETDVVKNLKDSLKIDDEEAEPDTSPPEPTVEDNKLKRRHGVGFKLKERVVKSVEQVKLLNKFKGDSKKKTLKHQKSTNNKQKPSLEQTNDSENPSRLDLIFNNFKKKRR